MQPRARVALVAALVFAAGCYAVNTTRAPNANLAQYHTFAFVPPRQASLATSPTSAVIRNAVTRTLEEKGLRPAPAGQQPDFLVSYHLVKQRQISASGWGWPYGYWGVGYWGWGGPTDVYEYTTGTVVIDFVDPSTRLGFWRGTATMTLNAPENPEPKKVDKAVAKIVGKYPVQMAAGARTVM
jgi:hypothetical protein